MASQFPPGYDQPIPNNPFYSPDSNYIRGEYGPFILGAGFTVDSNTGVIEVSGGAGGVTTVVGGLGISVSPTAGNVIVTNTGVRTLTAGAGITLTGTAQDITIASSGGASGVTSITAGTGLTGGTITTSGTITLANTIVAPGSYTYGSFTVNQQGRLTAASSGVTPVTAVTGSSPISVTAGTTPVISVGAAAVGTPGVVALNNSLTSTSTTEALTAAQGNALANQIAALPPNPIVSVSAPVTLTGTALAPNIGISSASTTGAGAVQLTNALNSSSETLALTACAGKCLQEQIALFITTPGIDFAGTIDASTGLVASVTTVGSAAGYTVGLALPAADATTVNTYVIVTTPGTFTPPGGSPATAGDGDWFLASEVSTGVYSWQLLNVGFDAPAASTSVQGIVCLSTNALAQAGTDTTTALTPAAAASAYVPLATYATKGDLLAATAANTPAALPVGSNGQVLTACSSSATGLCWASASVPAIPCACLTAKGSLVTASAASTPVELGVGTDGQVLTACAACSVGLTWAPAATPSIPCACITAKGTLVSGTAANTPTALPVGADGLILTACNACTTGLTWAAPAYCGDTPVGAVNWFASSAAPAGWLVANGAAVSRTSYAALFAAIGTIYGGGDGSTTFNLPDLRGQFLRGWDAAGGTARGCDPGRAFGSSQGFALQSHCHEMQVVPGGAGRPEWLCPNVACPSGAGWPSPTGGAVRSGGYTSTIGTTETRPTNVALLPCIKWQQTVVPANPSSCGIPCSTLVSKGSIVTATAADTPVALPAGVNGQFLMANSACSEGLQWATPSGGGPSAWISAGTVQAVGISATSIAPTVGTTLINNIRYRQLGTKEWEVQGVLQQTGAGTAGSGYYLFTLPAGLQFDVLSPYQKPYTGVPDNNQGWYFSGLIHSWTMIANTAASTYGRASITPYDATRYRISGNADYGVPNYINNGWYQLSTASLWWKWGFTFETP